MAKDRPVENSDTGTQRKDEVDSGNNLSAIIESDDKPVPEEKAADVSYGWLSWFSKTGNQTAQQHSPIQGIAPNQEAGVEVVDSLSRASPEMQAKKPRRDEMKQKGQAAVTTSSYRGLQPQTWLGLWRNVALLPEESKIIVAGEGSGESSHASSKTRSSVNRSEQDTKLSSSISQNQEQSSEVLKSPGWAFWSRENTKDLTSGTKETVGMLALAGSPSQCQPENAVVDEARGIPNMLGKKEKSQLPGKPEDQKSPELPKNKGEERNKSEVILDESRAKSTEQSRSKIKKSPTNLVLPSFRHTYRAINKPSLMQQVSRLLNYNRLPDTKRVSILQDPPRVQRALAIVSNAVMYYH